MSVYSFQTRVSYDDIDENLHLTLKGALGYMQEAAVIHSSKVGYSVGDVARTHVIWMLNQWRVRLQRPACWHDRLTVETWPRTMERATSIRDFDIRNESGESVCIGESNWVLVSADTGRIMRVPPEVVQAYDLTERTVFDLPLQKIAPSDGVMTYSAMVQRRDLDTNHHVNNRVYLDYALEALPAEVDLSAYREVIVKYHRQLLLNEPFTCWYRTDGDRQIVDIKSADGQVLHCTVVYAP